MKSLPSRRRSELRAAAHKLSPVVIIGDKGLTDEVIAEIDRSLTAHELIKVRAAGGERDSRGAWLDAICERLRAHPVQRIGKVLVIYRENPEEAKPKSPPRAAPRPGERLDHAKQKQRARDEKKRRERDIVDMIRKGKIDAKAKAATGLKLGPVARLGPGPKSVPRTKLAPGPKSGPRLRGDDGSVAADATRTSRPRSRTPSPLPESGPRRRRPRTSR